MKSERRHQLQENSLIRGARNLPDYWRESGSKVMLVIIAILLAVVLVRYWVTNRSEQAVRVASDLSLAQMTLDQWRDAPIQVVSRTPESFSTWRSQMREQFDRYISDVLDNSKDPAQQAEAKVIRADFKWQTAQYGDPPTAATQPAFQMKETPADLLASAEKDYNDVLTQQGTLPPKLVARARLGLAAIAEDRSDWPAARAQYDAIVNDARIPTSLKDVAKQRLTVLPEIEKPMVLGQPKQPPTAAPLGPAFNPPFPITSGPSTTQPAGTQPAGPLPRMTLPDTMPSGAPVPPVGPVSALPATAPAAVPATTGPATAPAGTQPTP
jgi:hypothetical protein